MDNVVTKALFKVTDQLHVIQAIFQASDGDPNNRDIKISSCAAQGLYILIDNLNSQLMDIGRDADRLLEEKGGAS